MEGTETGDNNVTIEPLLSETDPLLPLHSPENDPDHDSIADTHSKFTLEPQAVNDFIRRRLWWLCLLGILALIVLRLFFLPRTSPSRDFRRWHELHFTRSDVKRGFLVQSEIGFPGPDGHTVEENLDVWLHSLSNINKKVESGIASSASGASELTDFVESSMRKLGFKTSKKSYPILKNLQIPISSKLDLIDSKSQRVLYAIPLQELNSDTPSYYLFGKNGTVKASYVFCNEGSPSDFALLTTNSISLHGKIALFSHPLQSEYSVEDKISLAESAGCAGLIIFGEKATKNAISRNFMPIFPVEPRFRLPVSYVAIQPILQTLSPAPSKFPGWTHGPECSDESLKIELSAKFAESSLKATNIIGSIDGVLKDGEIVVGSSRDTLTPNNPLSGHAIMLETMRRLTHLRNMGWKPLRRIRFVSWDATRSGSLGSSESIMDEEVFAKNQPVLAYINLDRDVVTGSQFFVDSNPLFNHILKGAADLISFPRDSPYYSRLVRITSSEQMANSSRKRKSDTNGAVRGDVDDGDVSLRRYWLHQDNGLINNKVGHVYAGNDAGTFQLQLDTPTISLGFKPNPKFNDTLYVPDSETYCTEWVQKFDPNLDLHGSLVRFMGLLILSLGEHEVVDSRTQPYMLKVQAYMRELKKKNIEKIGAWANRTVSYDFLDKTALLHDLRDSLTKGNHKVTFSDVFRQLDDLIHKAIEQALVFDKYNQKVEDLWTTDYAWYHMVRKIHIYAKFKVTNYKLLRLEKELGQMDEWLKNEGKRFHHFMYDVPHGVLSVEEKQRRGAFAAFYEAFDASSMEQVVKLAAGKYERLNSLYRKIT